MAWLRSREGILGTSATGSFVVNLESVSDYADVVVLVLPIFEGNLAAFADFVGYTFVFAVFYEFPPRVLPVRGQQFAERRPVRLIVATTGLANTVIVTGALRETISHWWVIGVFVGSFVTLVLYVRFSPGFDLDDPNDPAVNVMAIIAHSDVENLDGEVWNHPIGKEVGVVGLGLTVAVFGWVTGLFGPIIGLAWPLPELLVVGWIGYQHVASRRKTISRDWLPNKKQIDVNSRLITSVAHLLRSNVVKGATVLAIMQLPVAWSGVILASGVFAVTTTASAIVSGSGAGLWVTLWVTMLILTCFIYGGYTAWFWLRELQRLPAHLVAWTAEHTPQSSQPSDDRSPPDPPTRPPDYLLVASLLYGWLTVAGLVSLARPELVRSPTLVAGLLVAVWGGLLVGLCYCVVWTRRHRPQSIKHEDRAFVSTLLIQYFGLALGTHFLLSHPRLTDVSPLPGGLVGEPLLYFIPAVIVLIFYFPNVGMHSYAANGVRAYAFGVYSFVVAAMFAATALVWAEASLLLWTSSVVIVLLIPLFYVARQFDRDRG